MCLTFNSVCRPLQKRTNGAESQGMVTCFWIWNGRIKKAKSYTWAQEGSVRVVFFPMEYKDLQLLCSKSACHGFLISCWLITDSGTHSRCHIRQVFEGKSLIFVYLIFVHLKGEESSDVKSWQWSVCQRTNNMSLGEIVWKGPEPFWKEDNVAGEKEVRRKGDKVCRRDRQGPDTGHTGCLLSFQKKIIS